MTTRVTTKRISGCNRSSISYKRNMLLNFTNHEKLSTILLNTIMLRCLRYLTNKT